MTERLRGQVSALADNELPESEHELLLRRFATEGYLRHCWERYHLIGEAMRKSLPQVDTRGFADRIMQALAGEATAPELRKLRRIPALRVAASVTAAVCVAVVALAVTRFGGSPGHLAAAPAEIVPPVSALRTTPVGYGAVSAAWNGNTPEVQAELNNYIINHTETSAALGRPDPLPYFYITTYNVNRTAPGATRAGVLQIPPRRR
ncbi:MAG: sigma-E factor negative regulatory protein [Gammaproteobacteria bacterium]|nr:sigma-E factor negative regulatory protein [Gammaproteobacteria bacterium]MDE2023077.1 sigma-E factor negative regulatory protein [Gammaproteobacteria bacterium]MDE2139795.1 sigma-E factor negative regulatory protein [Gammaproteobacteria bacterium]